MYFCCVLHPNIAVFKCVEINKIHWGVGCNPTRNYSLFIINFFLRKNQIPKFPGVINKPLIRLKRAASRTTWTT